MTRREAIEHAVEAQGLVIDDGGLIGGPFIPDGRYRIYHPSTMDVWGEGSTLWEAYEEAESRFK